MKLAAPGMPQRAVIFVACLAAAIPCVLWLAGGLGPPPMDWKSAFGPVALLFGLSTRHPELASWIPPFYYLAAVTGLVTSVFAALLVLRSYSIPAARMLSSSLAALGVSYAYFHFYRVFPALALVTREFPRAIADFAALLAMGYGTYWMVGFFASYPARIDAGAVIMQARARQLDLDRLPGRAGRMASFITRNFSLDHIVYDRRLLTWQVTVAILATLATYAFPGNLFFGIGIPAALVTMSVTGGFGACWHAIKYNYDHALADDRRRIEWIYGGFWVALLFFIALGAFAGLMAIAFRGPAGIHLLFPFLVLAPVAVFLMFVLSVAISIFYHGNIDPGLALRKTSVYALLGFLSGALFVATERAVALYAVRSLGLPEGLGPMIAGGVVAIAFSPLHAWIRERVDLAVNRIMPPSHIAEGERKEAAVVFSDLTGFTSLTARDEKAALTLAGLFHREARKVASAHHGRLVKTIGDAVLLEFARAEMAIQAVHELHRRFPEESRALGLPQLGVHSGINLGDVVQSADGDLYGATVNLAARLQGGAGDNELVTTAAVRDRMAHSGIAFKPLGLRRFKNVPGDVDCYLALSA